MNNLDDNKTKWNNRARTYDKSFRSKFFTSVQNKAIKIIELKPGMTFLDIGCGTGWTVKHAYDQMSGQGIFIGVDISEKMINIAKEKFRNIQSIKFIQSSAEAINLSPMSVDRIICTNSFHHYPDPVEVLSVAKKILRNNGLICIADVTTDFLFPRLLNGLLKKTEKAHVSFYNSNQYMEMARKAGLKYKTKQALNPIIKMHICEKIR